MSHVYTLVYWCSLIFLFRLCYVNSKDFQAAPRSLSATIKRASVISLASAISSFGVYTAYRFNKDEQVVNNFKSTSFQRYIARGMDVLEVGFGEGSGANLPYYPSDLKLTGIDPYAILTESVPAVVKRYKSTKNISLTLQKSSCESLPFATASFDVVVSTLVMCSVVDPGKCLSEVSRVLRPGGFFICQEHIHGETGSALAYQQELFDPLQQALANGCHLTRETNLLLNSLVLGKSTKNPYSFSKLLEQKIVLLSSHWPISRQFLAVLQK